MPKHILLILVDKRQETAVAVQKVLTEHGCQIKTRLGIHDTGDDNCSSAGLITLELIGNREHREKLQAQLDSIAGVATKLETMALDT